MRDSPTGTLERFTGIRSAIDTSVLDAAADAFAAATTVAEQIEAAKVYNLNVGTGLLSSTIRSGVLWLRSFR